MIVIVFVILDFVVSCADESVLRQMPSLANHSCPAQMLAATICNYIKSNPSATPFVKTGPMLFALKDSQMQGQEKPTPLANPHFV